MNFPAVIAGDERELAKRALATRADGHAPGVTGRNLDAYLAAGISTDHESFGLRGGAREAAARLLRADPRGVERAQPARPAAAGARATGPTTRRSAPTTASPTSCCARATSTAWRASRSRRAWRRRTRSCWPRSNGARCHGLTDRGAIAPGYRADFMLLPDLVSFAPEAVYKDGREVCRDGAVGRFATPEVPIWVRQSVHPRRSAGRRCASPSGGRQIRVIEIIPMQLITNALELEPTVRDGAVVADPARDLAKIAVIERHHATGQVGLGLREGLRPAARRVRHHRRPRRAQHRLRRRLRRGHGALRRAGWRRSAAASWRSRTAPVRGRARAAGGGADERPPASEVVPALDALVHELGEMGVARRGAVHDAVVPRAVGDPVAEDHRPGPDRRGALARSSRSRSERPARPENCLTKVRHSFVPEPARTVHRSRDPRAFRACSVWGSDPGFPAFRGQTLYRTARSGCARPRPSLSWRSGAERRSRLVPPGPRRRAGPATAGAAIGRASRRGQRRPERPPRPRDPLHAGRWFANLAARRSSSESATITWWKNASSGGATGRRSREVMTATVTPPIAGDGACDDLEEH